MDYKLCRAGVPERRKTKKMHHVIMMVTETNT